MRAITVCVEYDDLLSITLPMNRKHFKEYIVVTTDDDKRTKEIAAANNCYIIVTDAFYRRGAVFNKGLAIEEAFDIVDGWVCILDADIVLPKEIGGWSNKDGLYVPRRRIVNPVNVPSSNWDIYPLKDEADYAGYCQIFHTDSVHLNSRPWYGTDWKHAGGCDTDFERRFPRYDKHRTTWEVLHLGVDGKNWCGRITDRLDGRIIPERSEREATHTKLLGVRYKNYEGEKLC